MAITGAVAGSSVPGCGGTEAEMVSATSVVVVRGTDGM
jgi:hypothetical protein